MPALVPKAEFVGLDHVAHLAAGGETPVLRSHLDAVGRFLWDKSGGMAGRERFEAVVSRARAGIAALVGGDPEEVAFLASASEGLYVAAQGVDWQPGDNVVVERVEYPSNLYAWQSLRSRGVEVRAVGAGPVPSLGIHGVGILYVNRRRWPDLRPPWVGWHSVAREEDWRRRDGYQLKPTAERFEPGNLSFVGLYVLDNALRTLAGVGIERVAAHALALAGELRDGLVRLGLPVLTPEAPAARAGNVAFTAPDPRGIERRLAEAGVVVWAGDGRVRLSAHLYNDEADVARGLAALARVLG